MSTITCQQCGDEASGFTQGDVDDGEHVLCVECQADPLYQWTGEFEFPRQRAERLAAEAEYRRDLKEDR